MQKIWTQLLDALSSAANASERKKVLKQAVTGANKELFSSLAPYVSEAPSAGAILQFALEQAPDHPLYALGYATATSGTWPTPIYVAVRPKAEQPKRSVRDVVIDRDGDRIYAAEAKAVSVWSLETGEHLEDLKGSKDIDILFQRADGTLRGRTEKGEMFELKPGAKTFKSRVNVNQQYSPTDGRWLVGINGDYERNVSVLSIYDLDDLDGKGVVRAELPSIRRHAALIDSPRQTLIVSGEKNDEKDSPALWFVDLANGEVEELVLDEHLRELEVDANGSVIVGDGMVRARKSKKSSKAVPAEAAHWGWRDGRYLNHNTIHSDDGTELADFHILFDSNLLTTTYDPKRDRAVIFGRNFPLPMYLVDEWSAKTAAAPKAAGAKASAAPSAAAASIAASDANTLHPLLAKVGFRQADFDVDDRYLFECALEKNGALTIRYTSTAGSGAFQLSKDALAKSSKKIGLTQGDATLGEYSIDDSTAVDAFAPWLMPRAMFAALVAGEKIRWPSVWTGNGSVELKAGAQGSITLKVDGKPQTFPTLQVVGDDVQLELIADAAWPIVVRDQEGDDCGWTLLAAGKKLKLAQLEGDDDDDGDVGSGEWRRYEMDEKFWAIKLEGATHTVQFGKRGTNGQQKTKDFADEAAAEKDYDKLIAEKTKKGYELV